MTVTSPKRSRKQAQSSVEKNTLTALLPCILIFCTLLTFLPVIRNDFVNFDDVRLIISNPLVINGKDVLVKDFFLKNLYSPHYKPLVFLSWNIECRLFGLNPKVFHLNNLLLHICNVILLWYLSRLLITRIPYRGRKMTVREHNLLHKGLPFLMALLFALHPLHVESIAWASERKDLLCTFFYLMSLIFYTRQGLAKKPVLLILSALCYLLVIGSKAMGITLFAVLFLVDLIIDKKFSAGYIFEKLPHLAVLITALFLYGLLGNFTAYANGLTDGIVNDGSKAYPTHLAGLAPGYLRVLVISTRIMLWLQHIILPVKLSPLYMQKTIVEMLGYGIHLLPLLLMVIILLTLLYRKKSPYLCIGFLFFLITLTPGLAIDERGVGVYIPDRYTYIPLIGILASMTGIAGHLILMNTKLRPIVLATCLSVIVLYGISSHRLCHMWKNGETLWSHVLDRYPGEAAAWNGRGNYYNQKGDTLKALNDFNRAIALDPACYWAYNGRARIYCSRGELDSALQDYLLITRVDPWFTEGFTNLGAVYGMKGQYEKALKALERAHRLKPSDPDILLNRGVTYLNLKDYVRCIIDLQAYLQYKPGNADVINTLGVCYLRLGQVDEAVAEFQTALQLKPDFDICRNNLSLALKSKSKEQRAKIKSIL